MTEILAPKNLPTNTDVYQLFSWYGHGPQRSHPPFIRDWPKTHAGQKQGTRRTPAEVGQWLQGQLDTRKTQLGEATHTRYTDYIPRVVESLERGCDSMCWAIWAADRQNLLQVAVVRDRPNTGTRHQ